MTYEEWNEAIFRHLFGADKADEYVPLATDALALYEAARGRGIEFYGPDDAEEDFLAAVLEKLSRRAGWKVAGIMRGQIPGSLGLLAVQVLAVYRMQRDFNYNSGAYWPRLRELLGEASGQTGRLPDGLTRELQEKLWLNFDRWLSDDRYCAGAKGLVRLPPRESSRFFVNLPMSQALLRADDLEHLPDFYRRCDLQAFERVPLLTLSEKVMDSLATEAYLWKPHARRVIQDELRQELAIEQIVQHLAEWDGRPSPEAATYQRTPGLRLWATISLKKRRGCFLNVGLLKKSSDGSWQRLSDVSSKALFSPSDYRHTSDEIYRPYGPFLRLLSKSPTDSGYIETRYLKPGQRVLLLYRPEIVVKSLIAERHLVGDEWDGPVFDIPGLPNGWAVLMGRLKTSLSTVPEPWREYIQLKGFALRAVGGLKLKRNVWMRSSGPSILVNNPESEMTIRVSSEGQEARSFSLVANPLKLEALNSPGRHKVWALGDKSSAITVVVRERELRLVSPDYWRLVPGRWPEYGEGEATLSLRGLCLLGEAPSDSTKGDRYSRQRVLMKALVSLRTRSNIQLSESEREQLQEHSGSLGRLLGIVTRKAGLR